MRCVDGKRRVEPWRSAVLAPPRMARQDLLGLAGQGSHKANNEHHWYQYRHGLCTGVPSEAGEYTVSLVLLRVVVMAADCPLFSRRKATGADGDPGTVTTLNHVLNIYGLLQNKTIGDVMDIQGPFLCYNYAEP